MRILLAIPALFLAGALGGCNTGAPEGVLPRDPVPPPPSVTGSIARPATSADRTDVPVRRRTLSVPDRMVTPRPASTRIEPVMTGRGGGLGLRF